jgi:hypothetical protein
MWCSPSHYPWLIETRAPCAPFDFGSLDTGRERLARASALTER